LSTYSNQRTGIYGLEYHGREAKWTVRYYIKLLDIALNNTLRIWQLVHGGTDREMDHFDITVEVSQRRHVALTESGYMACMSSLLLGLCITAFLE
jgi:hypothetical protein